MHVTPTPTDEEAAAITAVVTTILEAEQAAATAASLPVDDNGTLHLWVEASRRSAHRAGLQRGSWRLSGRLARRSRV
jgi:hypothetical protein